MGLKEGREEEKEGVSQKVNRKGVRWSREEEWESERAARLSWNESVGKGKVQTKMSVKTAGTTAGRWIRCLSLSVREYLFLYALLREWFA